jgi:hypothetical protein
MTSSTKSSTRINVLLVALISCVSFCFQSNAYSQHWTKLNPPTKDSSVTIEPYFINTQLGFAFQAELLFGGNWDHQNVAPYLSRTIDGGGTWTLIHYFDTIGGAGTSLAQLYFVAHDHGFAATRGAGLFETLDTGTTWKRITPDGLVVNSVYSVGGAIFAALDDKILISRDGRTWDSLSHIEGLNLTQLNPFVQNISGNHDSLIATIIVTQDYVNSKIHFDLYLVYSIDRGLTWKSTLLQKDYRFIVSPIPLYISPHSCEITLLYLDNSNNDDDTYSFLTYFPKNDSSYVSISHQETGGWIAGNNCARYISNATWWGRYDDFDSLRFEEIDTNFFRSTDQGRTWRPLLRDTHETPIETEIDDWDWRNISVVGHGAVVYAGDGRLPLSPDVGYEIIGGLWKTTDGGDGSLSAKGLAPQFELSHLPFASGNDTLIMDTCHPDYLILHNQNIACSYATFDGITIDGLLLSEYLQLSTHHCGCTPMPDTTFVTLVPKTIGIRDLTVHYHFTDDEFNQIDTSIRITLNVRPDGTAIILSAYLKSTSTTAHAGDTIDIPIYLSGNDTLSGSTSISLPFSLDTNVLVPVGFYPSKMGITAGSIVWSGERGPCHYRGQTLCWMAKCSLGLCDVLFILGIHYKHLSHFPARRFRRVIRDACRYRQMEMRSTFSLKGAGIRHC